MASRRPHGWSLPQEVRTSELRVVRVEPGSELDRVLLGLGRRCRARRRFRAIAVLPRLRLFPHRSSTTSSYVRHVERMVAATAMVSIPRLRDCRSRRRAPWRRVRRLTAPPASSSRCAHACARCRERCATRPRSPAPCAPPRRGARPRARGRIASPAAARTGANVGNAHRDVLNATSRTRRSPVTTSAWARPTGPQEFRLPCEMTDGQPRPPTPRGEAPDRRDRAGSPACRLVRTPWLAADKEEVPGSSRIAHFRWIAHYASPATRQR